MDTSTLLSTQIVLIPVLIGVCTTLFFEKRNPPIISLYPSPPPNKMQYQQIFNITWLKFQPYHSLDVIRKWRLTWNRRQQSLPQLTRKLLLSLHHPSKFWSVYKWRRKGENQIVTSRFEIYCSPLCTVEADILNTYLNDLSKDFSEAHRQCIGFLFQKTMPLLRTLQSSFHQRQGPKCNRE